MDTQVIVAIIGAVASMVVAIIALFGEKKEKEGKAKEAKNRAQQAGAVPPPPSTPSTPSARPKLVFAATVALGLAITGILLALFWPRPGPALPVGSVIPFWGNVNPHPPFGYEICNGELVATSKSPLQGKRKPDLRGRFVKGASKLEDTTVNPIYAGNKTVDKAETAGTVLTVAQMPKHNHPARDVGHSHGMAYSMGNRMNERDRQATGDSSGRDIRHTDAAAANIQVDHVGGDESHSHKIVPFELEPPHLELVYLIRVL